MRIVVTGANGMLGQDLCPLLEQAGHEVLRTDLHVREGLNVPAWEPLDITNTESVARFLLDRQPDAVIHCAAYTHVDNAERNPDDAYRVNAFGTWNLAAICGAHNITFTYISTDFVFDGEKQEPYTEFDPTNPLSHYGASKLAGEKLVAQLCRRHFIVRTSWLFGVHGPSFPTKILELARTRPELPVVCDQVGSPTHTVDLAEVLVMLQSSPLYGTYHVCNAGHCSWYEFAQKIVEAEGINIEVKPVPASTWPSPTRRPSYSVMRRYSLELQGRDNLRPWIQALDDFMERRRRLLAS